MEQEIVKVNGVHLKLSRKRKNALMLEPASRMGKVS